MPKMESWGNYNYEPHTLVRKALKSTPYDQTKAMPENRTGTGKLGGLGPKVTGGDMNMGGKRRPGHSPRRGID